MQQIKRPLTLRGYYADHGKFYPNICGDEHLIAQNTGFYEKTQIPGFDQVTGCFATLLHAHQPLILAEDSDLTGSPIVSNFHWMARHRDVGDCFMVPAMTESYLRFPLYIVPQLVAQGYEPRIALEYTGTLFHGLLEMRLFEVIEAISNAARNPDLQGRIEFLGAPWGHAHAPTTDVQDYLLHVLAWRHHFAAICGPEALARVRMFSPSEMALPNNLDVAYRFVNTLRHNAYDSVVLQAGTVETLDGQMVVNPFTPYRLLVEDSNGQQRDIICILKDGDCNGPVVAEMRHAGYAKEFERVTFSNREIMIPKIALQIMDMENGPEMMGPEFPENFIRVTKAAKGSKVIPVNPTEYLDSLFLSGISKDDLPVVQPLQQHLIWSEFKRGSGPQELQKAIARLKEKHPNFQSDGSSWTPERTWSQKPEYQSVLEWMEAASRMFDERVRQACVQPEDWRYREVLFHLLAGQTSCYRYWGQSHEGIWPKRGIEICKRTIALIEKYFGKSA